MKDALKDFLLWQNKRNELPVIDDPHADWGQMESLLDEHMPVVKKTGGFKGFRGLPAILITFSAAAMIYVTGNIYSLEKHTHRAEHHFHKGNPRRPGTQTTVIADSLNTKADTGNISPDSGDTSAGRAVGLAVNDKDSPANKVGQAGGSITPNGAKAANRLGHGLNDDYSRTNPSASHQKNNQSKNAAQGRKSSLAGGNPLGHAGVNGVTWGYRNSSQGSPQGGNSTAGGKMHTNQIAANSDAFTNRGQDNKLTASLSPPLTFNLNLTKIQPLGLPVLGSRLSQTPAPSGKPAKGSTKDKPRKTQNSKPSNIDWGILMGVNTSGSFTPKSQNANFYGSAPADPYFGLFASYKINANWALATEVHLFSPQNITTSYSQANKSSVDSGQSLTITASRKEYAISLPVYAVYNTGNGLSFKAGPVVNFPVKQINTNSILLPSNIRTDTTYYKNISTLLNATQYQQRINFGFSFGAAYQFRRFIFEATYLKSLSGYGISSGLGSYKSYNGTLQFTIGFQLDKVKP